MTEYIRDQVDAILKRWLIKGTETTLHRLRACTARSETPTW